MKTLKLVLMIMAITLFSNELSAQVSLSVNIGTPRYYYLQDIGAYYDIQASMYIHLFGGRWLRSRSLPESYGHFDFNNSHRVIIQDYRGNRPYYYYKVHKANFPKGHYRNSEHNYWSVREHKAKMNNNNNSGKEYRREGNNNNNSGKEYRRNDNNNKGNGGKMNGNSKGSGHGKGNKK